MSNKEVCDRHLHDPAKAQELKTHVLDQDTARLSRLFKALAEENRAKLVYALTLEGELCVCDLSHIINATVATTSHHLRSLYKEGLVKYEKKGKQVFYSLDDDHVDQIITIAMGHISHL